MNTPIISFRNVNFGYSEDKQVINNLSFDIMPNTYTAIIGHNGCGKSTTSKLLMGILKPNSGSIFINGILMEKDNVDILRETIGIIFQNPDNQFVGMTVIDDLVFGLENKRVPREYMDEIVNKVSHAMGIQNILTKQPSELSGGQKQKVAIASVLCLSPNVIIFDESTSMLDPISKSELKKLMVDLVKIGKKTVISITHDMDEVVNADQVLVIDKGTKVAHDIPSKIFENVETVERLQLDLPPDLKLSYLLNKNNNDIPLSLSNEQVISNIVGKINKYGK